MEHGNRLHRILGRALAALCLWLSLALAAPAAQANLDVDGDGATTALTDGLLIIRHLFGLSGDALTSGALGNDATRDAAAIASYIDGLDYLDVDGDGTTQALTDGLLVIRYLFGLTGDALTSGATGAQCARCESQQIADYIAAASPPAILNQALLGPLSGATINAYRLDDLDNPIEGPSQAAASPSDLVTAGTFSLVLQGVPDQEWILVSASGGQDIDADDDGVLDDLPTVNLGTIHALAQASDWRGGGLRINVLTEIAWQTLEEEVSLGQVDDLDGRLRWIANKLFADDVTKDGDLDYRDIAAFDPRFEAFRKALDFPFSDFLAANDAGRSLFDEIHDGQEEAVRDWIAAFFGNRLQVPQAPEIVDVATEVQLPVNRENLQGQDLLISSAVSSGAQIFNQGVTLMIAKDADGHPVLLAFALPGEVARFSPSSTALALVMLSLGGSRDTATFSELASQVTAQAEFAPLVVAIENTLAADPFLLERLTSYVDLVDQVKSVVTAVKAAIAIAPASAPAPLVRQKSRATDLAAEPSLPIAKEDFYCIPFVSCSPWDESEPWDWYGDAKGAKALWPDGWYDVLLAAHFGAIAGGYGAVAYLAGDAYAEILPDFTRVPFLAVSQENQTEIGLANPGAASYAFELLAGDGSVTDWFLTPRSTSLFDKLLNSGAAQRSLYSVENDAHRQSLNVNTSWVRFNRYPDWSTSQGKAVTLLNGVHGAISLLNLVNDFSAVSKTLEEIGKSKEALRLLGTCTGLDGVRDALLLLEDLAWDTTAKDNPQQALSLLGDVLKETLKSIAEHLVSAEGVLCFGKVAKVVGRDWSKAFGQQVVASSLELIGTLAVVKLAFDAVNDFVPNALSLVWPWSEQQDYYLTWDLDASNNPILIDVATIPPIQGPLAPPRALFTTEQGPGGGLTVHFDGSSSKFDVRATPSFIWDFGDGTSGSGELVSHTYGSPGQTQVRLTVDDGLGQTDEQTSTITVHNGVAPVINDMTCHIDPNDARRVLVQAVVTDADGDLAEFQWWRSPLALQSLPDEVTAPDDPDVELTYPDDGIDVFSPTMHAKDHAGNISEPRTCMAFPSGAAGTHPLNDTGITWGGDYPDGNNATCTSNIAAPQDCHQGRDAAAAAGTLTKVGAGHGAFDFTKLDANGNDLPAGVTQWSCVRDNHTGLVWEVKTDDGGIHDKDNTYRWGGKTALGSGYGTYYDDWNSLVDGSNAGALCGFADWRLPTVKELENLVSRDRYSPAIDTAYFPNTVASDFWSSSPSAYDSSSAWNVYFYGGYSDGYGNRLGDLSVRLVRSGQ